MPTDLRFALPAIALTTVCAVTVVVRAATAPVPPAKPHATPTASADFAKDVAANEAEWLKSVTEHFPSDSWSERDDFGGLEYQHDRKLSEKGNVRLEDVLRAVDDDIHAQPVVSPLAPDPRAAKAVPCKPRPFYD